MVNITVSNENKTLINNKIVSYVINVYNILLTAQICTLYGVGNWFTVENRYDVIGVLKVIKIVQEQFQAWILQKLLWIIF